MVKISGAKTRISITIIPMVNLMLEKVSKKTGVSKSALVENAIREYLGKQLEQDIKALSKISFNDLPTEDEWQSLQSDIN
jgi:hypothetical protein